jgi:hypothetical protein
MKTIHSCLLVIFIFITSPNTFAKSAIPPSWPDVSAVKWDIKNSKLFISWTASSDDTDMYYMLEKSADGKQFLSVGLILGGFQVNNQYEFSYRVVYEPGYQYRLKQVKRNGESRLLEHKSL